ncbi:AI-2E family transporter, partial [bacterium]|nr:AI-2E family transporter [bacterium]
MIRYPTPFQQKTLWNAATGVSILVLGALLVGFIRLLGVVFGFLQPVLIPLIVAGIVAYVLDPVVLLLERRGMSRLWAVITLFLAILVAVTLLVAAVLPGVQRGRGALRDWMSAPAKTSQSANPGTADPTADEDDDAAQLAPT